MRIVIISDSHRNTKIIDKILFSQPNAKYVFFLGDNEADIEDFDLIYPDKVFYTVSGNCDFASLQPTSNIAEISNTKIFYTHGHTLNVKYTTNNLIETAKKLNCKIALYGHTHTPQILYSEGIYIVNPGSCSRPRNSKPSYAVIDIEPTGIMPIIINLDN